MKLFGKWFLIVILLLMISAGGFFLLEQKTATVSYQQAVQKVPATDAPADQESGPIALPVKQNSNIRAVKIGGTQLKVDLALTPEAQAQGLSGRTSLASDSGMLFAFDTPGKYSFWMKDMNFAIDMVWFDAAGTIVFIEKDATPQSYPKTFTPAKDASYVLEVASGFSAKHNLKIGDKVDFIY